MHTVLKIHWNITEGVTVNITIYTKSGCPNCTAAKRLLDDKGIGYDEYSADGMTPEEIEVFCGLGIRQMPRVFIEGQRVGGLTGLQQALKELGL
jgi:glutaredoxin 3